MSRFLGFGALISECAGSWVSVPRNIGFLVQPTEKNAPLFRYVYAQLKKKRRGACV